MERTEHELRQLETYYRKHAGEVAQGDWGAVSAVALGVHNVYNGIEHLLTGIARDIDGAVPTGPAMHQDILDQMAAGIAGIRPALLTESLYSSLIELKGFRHLVRHKYGFDLKPDRVVENVERMLATWPQFVTALEKLERSMHTQNYNAQT
ncbi:hypothetical protein [Rhizobium halophytocola]|uniref:Uncharacterized protein YutE (UPF0331/DUF86 family) n=1 Tax=Rhizobium halophytocola TaxID=735519 RepID=A0ABS4E626_9HYPH|nr:hypothetical protein [Rhizobium halophytocola]MBP1853394.1 uncharacterized protein YutE (UPF0331/DUF86 family) [Rhizobium halophytocola]